MEITRIDVAATGKVVGLIYSALGLIFGLIVTLMALTGSVVGSMMNGMGGMGAGSGMHGMFGGWIFGVAAVFVLPVIQGILGFITGALVAWIYNRIAPRWGGLVLETREGTSLRG